jgi:hypothetical protein
MLNRMLPQISLSILTGWVRTRIVVGGKTTLYVHNSRYVRGDPVRGERHVNASKRMHRDIIGTFIGANPVPTTVDVIIRDEYQKLGLK